MATIISRVSAITTKYPMVKGMISYTFIWPTGCFIQQTMGGARWDTYDWKQCMRYSLFGCCFVAPTLYGWIRFSSRIWPQTNLKTGITKAVVEQFSYGPAAMSSFFFLMNLLEGGTLRTAADEVQDKFWPTYKIGVCYWPFLQTINFAFIAEKNRVPFVGMCSLVWTIILAYMKQLEAQKEQKQIKL